MTGYVKKFNSQLEKIFFFGLFLNNSILDAVHLHVLLSVSIDARSAA